MHITCSDLKFIYLQSKKFQKLEDIHFEDLQLWGYMPQPNISAPMAV
jgi:thymidylate synthase